MTDDDTDAPRGVAPKLTIGQRLLTALPNLQRQPASAAPATHTNGASTKADDTDADTDADAIEADADAIEAATDGATTRRARLRDSFLTPAPAKRVSPADALASMSREEIAHRIKKLDDRERLLALFAAPTGTAVGLLLTGFALHLNPAVHVKGHVSNSLILLEGGARILLSGLVVAAALSRRRSLVGFALLFLGTAMGSPLFALPFWGLGGYLIWRVFKYQKVLNARGGTPGRTSGRATGGSRVPANPRAAARAESAAGRTRAQAARQRGRKQPEPAGPTPSKRYTPPKPTRPRPPAPPT